LQKPQLLYIFLLALLVSMGSVFANPIPVITMADKPVQLIRGTVLYRAATGVGIQKGDFIETGPDMIQIEASPSITLALAPNSRLLINEMAGLDNRSRIGVTLLNGWLKLVSKLAQTNKPVLITSTTLQMRGGAGSLIVHSDTNTTKIFVEEGGLEVTGTDDGAKSEPWLKVKQEQYVTHVMDQPIKIAERPARDFISGMPQSFRDPLISVATKLQGKILPPTKTREVNYADVEAWLTSDLPNKKYFVKQFSPRLRDADFRRSLDAKLGQSLEWKGILHPPIKQ